MSKSLYSTLAILFMIVIYLVNMSTVTAASGRDLMAEKRGPGQPWNKRPRQFRMQVYSRPDAKGVVQTLRTSNGASTPCWNLASKRVGSYDLNDPLVKVTFYRSSDCRGAPSATFYQGPLRRSHVMLKSKSVSITKVKPILLKDHDVDL